MELVAYFENFLLNEVNLNQSRVDVLNEKMKVIEDFLKNNEKLKKYYKGLIPQGSYGQKTIIKPPKEGQEFDADILLSLQKVDGWQSKDYVENLYKEFQGNGNYKKIVQVNTRCVTLNYAGDFHIDIVPFLQIDSKFFITNKDDNGFEQTNPIAYTEWFMGKNKKAFNHLIEAIRLFKYLRDVKQNFSVKSILINTLIGNCIDDNEIVTDFRNLPTAFVTIFTRLNSFLQANSSVPAVVNPTLPEEDFNRHWDQEKYSNFREKLSFYAQKIKEAYEEKDKTESIKKWRTVFGDQFPLTIDEDSKTAALSGLSSKSRPWSY